MEETKNMEELRQHIENAIRKQNKNELDKLFIELDSQVRTHTELSNEYLDLLSKVDAKIQQLKAALKPLPEDKDLELLMDFRNEKFEEWTSFLASRGYTVPEECKDGNID